MAQSGTGDGSGRRDKPEINTKAVCLADGDSVIIYDPENVAAWLQSDYALELPGDP